MVTGPGLARAVATNHTDTLRKAIAGLAMLAREVVRLKAELRERDEMIRELQAMVSRAYVDTERPGAR